MPFSDDDLKRLKDEFNRGLVFLERDGVRIDDVLEALLARLEAAEKAIEPRCSMYCGNCECAEDYKAWLKSKGEK